MRSRILFSLWLVSFILVFGGERTFPQESLGEWTSVAPMPTARKEISNATVELDGKIYVIGGVARDGQITPALEIYDPATDSWSSGHPVPVRVWRAFAAAALGKLYLFGGYTSTAGFPFSPIGRVFEYDPQQDDWTEMTAMPTARGTAVAVTVGSQIHVLGGAANSALSTHQVFDPVNNSWSSAPTIPTPRSGLTAAVIDGEIYVAGGYLLSGGVVSQSVLQVYSPQNQSWRSVASMPIPRHGLASAAVGGKMYVFGGASNPAATLTLEYDPGTDSWSSLAEMPSPVSFMGVAAVRDTIHVIGGGPVNLNRFDGLALNRRFVPPGTVTSIKPDPAQPRSFVLQQNFPNPFNPSTRIDYQLSEDGPVTFTIYNLLGNVVRTLVNEQQTSGDYRIDWDGRDDRQQVVASGIYIYRLRTASSVGSRRMLLLR